MNQASPSLKSLMFCVPLTRVASVSVTSESDALGASAAPDVDSPSDARASVPNVDFMATTSGPIAPEIVPSTWPSRREVSSRPDMHLAIRSKASMES